MALPSEFLEDLRKRFAGDIRLDQATRVLYSTDASIYQVEPLAVLIPRTRDDLQAAVELAAHARIPILPRGAGTSLAGQAIGPAVILDCSRWLDHILALDPEARIATVEPGLVLDALNHAAAIHGLQFGPDPASAERATMGGIVANNGTGAHSIRYGMAADHIKSAEVVLSDGSAAVLGEVALPAQAPSGNSTYQRLLGSALRIRADAADDIKARYPRSWRNSAGYRLNYLLGWSHAAPPEWVGTSYPADLAPSRLNLAHLLAGSEGTLAVMQSITVGLVPKPLHNVLVVLQFPTLGDACDAVPDILGLHPSAIELVSRLLLRMARGASAAGGRLGWLRGDPEAILVVEFSGDVPDALRGQAARLDHPDAVVLESQDDQADVWAVRKLGLGLLDSQPRPARPISFVEDCAIPVDNLGEYVRGMQRIMEDHQATGGIYGHASAGCLHIRPVLDLRTEEGRINLRSISRATAALAVGLGGSMTSEHGDGVARAEWLSEIYGQAVVEAMRELKMAADPEGILNPGKKLEAPPVDQNLRYGPDRMRHAWSPGFDFGRQGGLSLAIERCNGQGVCRKPSGVMCPSFQATREEMHSTRGRANLLRALITTRESLGGGGVGPSHGAIFGSQELDPTATDATFEALDLCLACKGCTAECPSGVDMPALKAEFLRAYYESHPRPIRDYLFGYFHITARWLSTIAPIINAATRIRPLRSLLALLLGIAGQRPFPRFAPGPAMVASSQGGPTVLFLRDPFTHFIEGHVERSAFDLLRAAGVDIRVIEAIGAGASMISRGFFASARDHAKALLSEMANLDPTGSFTVVAIEPSEISALRHDYASLISDLTPDQRARLENVESVEGFLNALPAWNGLRIGEPRRTVRLHPHCHQKADDAARGRAVEADDPSLIFLRNLGFDVGIIPAGCCGMAGTFGYEAEHYELSQKVGELALFGWIRKHPNIQVTATGAACRMQINQGTGVAAEHPLVLAANALRLGSP